MAHVAETDDQVFRQCNLVRSRAGALRGMHAHSRYTEYYIPVSGRMYFVLKDARLGESTFGAETSFWVEDGEPVSIEVPIGVAHGVFFAEPGILAYGLSNAWTGNNEFGCRWDDPAILSPWPVQTPLLSERDEAAGSFDAMADAMALELAS